MATIAPGSADSNGVLHKRGNGANLLTGGVAYRPFDLLLFWAHPSTKKSSAEPKFPFDKPTPGEVEAVPSWILLPSYHNTRELRSGGHSAVTVSLADVPDKANRAVRRARKATGLA